MADLFNQQISATYSGLLKTSSSGVLSASLSQISDGRGNTSPLYLSTDSIQFYGAYSFPNADGSANQVLKTDGAGVLTWEDDANTGTVTSVALSVPTGLTVTGSPITTNGTITIGGTLGVANGGTGATTLTGILLGNGTSAISAVSDGTVGQVLSTNANGTYSFIDAGTGDVTVDGASVGNRVAVWNNTTGELRGTSAIATENSNIYLSQPSTNGTDKFNYIIGGAFAINENDFGTQNTGFGHRVFNGADLTGGNNSAFGMESLYSLTTGSHNTSIGSFAMHDNRSGNYNVGLGTKAMFNQRISNYNVAIGYDSMDGVTASQTAVSDYNTAVGYQSLQSIQGGDNNTVIGKDSGNAITTGSNNVIIGSNTGSTIATSSNNIIISDGGGNIRQSFDITGAATFSGVVSTTSASSIGFLAQTTANSVYPYFRWVANNRSYWAAAIDNGTDATFKIGSGNTIDIGSLFEIDSFTNTATFSGTTSANVVISRDNKFVGLGQLYIGAENSNTDDTYRQSVGSGIFKIQSRESGTWTDRLTISSGGNATFNETTTLNATGNSYTDGSLVLRNSDGTTNTYLTNAAGAFYLSNNGTSAALTISSGGAATFSGSVTCVQLNASVAISMEAAGTNSVAAGGYYRYLNTSNSYQILKQINTNTDEDTWAFRGSWNKIGTLNASTGVYTALSDINKKKDFEESTIGLSAIIGLKPTLYRMKDDESEGKKELGFIAQEVKDYIPQAYVENGDDDYQFVGLNYNAIVATLTKAIQEQQTIIEDLKSRIETLEG